MRLAGVEPGLLLALLLPILNRAAAQDTVTIFDASALKAIRPCASTCIYRVGSWIQCPSSPLVNSCFCRTDLTEIARKSLAGCVADWCNNGVSADGVAMTSIYMSYCQSINGNEPANNVAQTTSADSSLVAETDVATSVVTSVNVVTTEVESVVSLATGTITTRVQSTLTQVIYSTFTTILDDTTLQQIASQYQSNQSSGLQRGDKIAIAVGVIALIIITLLLFQNPIRRRFFGYQGPYLEPMPVPTGGIDMGPPRTMGQAEMGHTLAYREK
ncbi:hypothetical protein Dda_9063 [Drechslerella dactyloides]|uniref:Extracellular membrane protein CFEM domain-containing protein n=1 Tax=Drechslerella dactyloides TaxID=74499 RepID=A0AAD6IQ05_DREDA|nr:hypothetical protein Dda_9063 [Drechslerella dactyloides]